MILQKNKKFHAEVDFLEFIALEHTDFLKTNFIVAVLEELGKLEAR